MERKIYKTSTLVRTTKRQTEKILRNSLKQVIHANENTRVI